MADNESSHLMWIIIVVAIAALIFMGLKVAFPGLIDQTMDKMTQGVKGIDIGGDDNNSVEKPNSEDSKWVQKGNYGTNGYFVMDGDGNGIVYALDDSKPITVIQKEALTANNTKLVTLSYISPVEASKSLNNFFVGNTSLKEIKGLDKWSTKSVNDMSYMFMGNSSLTSLDLSKFDTSNVVNFNSMFRNMSNLTDVNLSSFNTSNSTNFGYMFAQDAKLNTLDLSTFKTSNVIDMSYMFQGLSSMTNLNISNFDATNVNTMKFMFQLNSKLKTVDVSNVVYTKVSSVDNSNMFVSVDATIKTQLSKALLNK